MLYRNHVNLGEITIHSSTSMSGPTICQHIFLPKLMYFFAKYVNFERMSKITYILVNITDIVTKSHVNLSEIALQKNTSMRGPTILLVYFVQNQQRKSEK